MNHTALKGCDKKGNALAVGQSVWIYKPGNGFKLTAGVIVAVGDTASCYVEPERWSEFVSTKAPSLISCHYRAENDTIELFEKVDEEAMKKHFPDYPNIGFVISPSVPQKTGAASS